MIHELLQNLTAKEKADLKGKEIAKLGSIQRELHGKYEIEITDLKAIEGGVEFYVRAWDNGVPVGLGVGNKFETEHFRIFDPEILVLDPNGDIVKTSKDDITGKITTIIQREDLREALLSVVEYIIKVSGKKGTAILGSVGNTTSTFNPQIDSGGTSADGWARHDSDNTAWGTIVGGAGTSADNTDVNGISLGFLSGSSSNWRILWRPIYTFDTSSIPDTDTISSATLSIFGSGKLDENSATPTGNIYSSAPADNSNIVAGDYDSLGSTAFSTAITYANWSTTAYNDFALNASGIANISKTGVSPFGFRNPEYDVANSAPPSGGASKTSKFVSYYADNGSNQPKLVVVHAASSSIKTWNGLAKASVKTVNGLAIASVKTINGLA